MMTGKKFTPRPLLDPAEFAIEPIDKHPRYAEALAKLIAYQTRLRQTQVRRERILTALRLRRAGGNATTLTADQLVDGANEPGYSTQGELDACETEEFTLRKEISAQAAKLDEIRADLSLETCRRFGDEDAAIYREMLAALIALREAVQANAALRARLQAAGYRINESALPSGVPWSVHRALADSWHHDGAVGLLRKFIDERKL